MDHSDSDSSSSSSSEDESISISPPPLPASVRLIQASIEALEDIVGKLTEARTRVINASAPVHRLSDKLLGFIFTLGSYQSPSTPIIVAGVCHSWRAIAVATPSMWTNISIPLARNTRSSQPAALEMLHLYVQKSESLPLAIDLNFASRCFKPDPSILLEVLEPHFWRCHTLKVDGLQESFSSEVSSARHFPQFCKGLLGENSRLRSLTLLSSLPNWKDHHLVFSRGNFPVLRSLTLKGVLPASLPVTFPNLEVFRLDSLEHPRHLLLPEFTTFLQSLHSLRELSLRACFFELPSSSTQTILGGHPLDIMTSLSSLSLTDMEPQEIAVLLGAIAFPQLRQLTLGRPPPPPSFDLTAFLSVYAHHFSTLTNLRLFNIAVKGSSELLLLQALQQMPLLKGLVITDCPVGPLFLGGFVSAFGLQPVAPALTELVFKNCTFTDPAGLLDIAHKRKPRLLRMQLVGCAGIQPIEMQLRNAFPEVRIER